TDLQLSPDGTHVFIVVTERTDAAKRPNVPNYVTESSYTEDIPARTFVGDAQDSRTLVVMNTATGKTVTADASFDSSATKPDDKPAEARDGAKEGAAAPGRTAKRETRWSMPQISDDGAIAVAHVRSQNNKNRWLVAVDPESGTSRVLDALHDDAWVRELGGFG